jgi:hypothetical protein
MSIYKHDEIDVTKINYLKPEKQGVIYYSPISYKNEPFYLQIPKMICKKGRGEVLKKNLNIDMENINTDFSFYDFLLNFDELNINETHKNNKEWFGKDIPLELIDNMYKRSCKPVKKDNNPTFSFRVPIIKDKVQCQIYDQKKTCIEFSRLDEGMEMICILHIKGLKFLRQHYYCDCYITQIKVFLEKDLKYSILDKYAFNDKEEEANELIELEQELKLDSEYIESLKNSEDEKVNLQAELESQREILNSQKELVRSIEMKIKDL